MSSVFQRTEMERARLSEADHGPHRRRLRERRRQALHDERGSTFDPLDFTKDYYDESFDFDVGVGD